MVDISDNTKWSEADASNNATSPNGFPENMMPSGVNDSARMVMGALKRFYNHNGPTLQSGGSANAQTLTYSVAPTAYVTGDVYEFIVGTGLTNTGATTLNVNGLGAKNILLGPNALQGRELKETQLIRVGYDGTQFQLLRPITPFTGGFTPSNPTGTASATDVMMGVGSTITATLKVSGAISIYITGDVRISAIVGNPNNTTMQIRYGTGTAPANGDAVTGTAAGSKVNYVEATATSNRIPFTCLAHITALSLGTAYWFDLAVSTASGNTATLGNLSADIREDSR